MLRVRLKPVSRLTGLVGEFGQGGVMNSILEVFPSITGVSLGWPWERFPDCSCKLLYLLLVSDLNGIDARFSLLSCVVHFL